MNKSLTVCISIIILFIMMSSATAIPHTNSMPIIKKLEEIEHNTLLLNKQIKDYINIHPIFRTIDVTTISDIIGFFYIIVGLISLYYTILILMLAFVAITFNPGGYIFFVLALFSAILTTIFLSGGIKLISTNNPLSNLNTIFSLSLVLFMTWIILKLKGYSFILLIKGFLHYILDYLYSIIEYIIEKPFLNRI